MQIFFLYIILRKLSTIFYDDWLIIVIFEIIKTNEIQSELFSFW